MGGVWCHEVVAIARTGHRPSPHGQDADPGHHTVEERWRDALVALGAGTVLVASGCTAHGPGELPVSHSTAREGLRGARAIQRTAVQHQELAFERLLAVPRPQLGAFVEQQLGSLAHEGAGDLCLTLETFLRLGSAAEAARRLFIHYNTMKHRLVRITVT